MDYSQPGPRLGTQAALEFANEVNELLEEDELANQEIGYMTRDNILFCIDGSTTMQRPLADSAAGKLKFDPEDVDADGNPLDTAGKGKSPLQLALESVLSVMRTKIMSGPTDYVGVLVYNVVRRNDLPSKDDAEGTILEQVQGLNLYLPLRQIGVEEVKKLNELVEEANIELSEQDRSASSRSQPSIISDTFQPVHPDDQLDTASVLEGCLHAFRDAGAKLSGNKRVFLVTDDDQPDKALPPKSSMRARLDARLPARTRAADLRSLGIYVDPFFISLTKATFDEEKYWNDILDRSTNEEAETADKDPSTLSIAKVESNDGLMKLKELMKEQVRRTSSKRVLFSVPLKFGGKDGDITISVNGYPMIAHAKKPAVRLFDLSGRQHLEAKSRTYYTSKATGARLDSKEIGYAYNFGKTDGTSALTLPPWQKRMDDYNDSHGQPGAAVKEEPEEVEQVEDGYHPRSGPSWDPTRPQIKTRIGFSTEDVKEYKTLGFDPQIKIIGFMSEPNVRFEHNVKNSVFLYPDEKTYSGSTRTFAALLSSCLKKDKCALAFAFTRRNTTPYYAALLPQPEQHSNPSGFHMIPLPFADDLRRRPNQIKTEMELCLPEQKEAMSKVVEKLKLGKASYTPEDYPNPELNFFYGQLQAMAFEEEFRPQRIPDKTLPLLDQMHKRGGQAMREFNQSIEEDERAHQIYAKSSGSGAAGKRVRTDGGEMVDMTSDFVEEKWRSGNLSTLTVAQLKAFAKSVGVHAGDKPLKGDWVRVIDAHFEKRSAGNKVKRQRIV